MTVDESILDRLFEAADEEPIAFDGLGLTRADDGYDLAAGDLELSGASERDVRRVLAEDASAHVTNWWYWEGVVGGAGTARRAFLRWCERASIETGSDVRTGIEAGRPVEDRYAALRDGVAREWGQLLVSVELSAADVAGDRRYELRHVDDARAEPSTLESRDGLSDVRSIATEDEMGRYRPLRTAPTLVDGWRLGDLDGDELVRLVQEFYPATVANWHRERRGELDVDHWPTAAERQTGIYDVVDELPREAVDWLAEACCVDSQCLRRREWQYDAEDPIDVDGGDGPFPCREPCSLVISAARRFAIDELETERTVALELTTTELNQLSTLIDAVADGRVDQIREADLGDGANRYRARYLRAKCFDEDGQLAASVADLEDE